MSRPPEPASPPPAAAADGAPRPPPPDRSGTEQSLESFAIATTPFHEPDEDGEAYMDEAGNMMQRWVTRTDVHAAKAAKAARRRRPDSGYAGGSGRGGGRADGAAAADGAASLDSSCDGSSSATLDSSEASAERRRLVAEHMRGRPPLRRASQSSLITADRANHRSPVPSASASPRLAGQQSPGATPTPTQGPFKPRPPPAEPSPASDLSEHSPVSDLPEPSPLSSLPGPSAPAYLLEDPAAPALARAPLRAALSCPSSPRQLPTALSPPPSPTHARRRSANDPAPPRLRPGLRTSQPSSRTKPPLPRRASTATGAASLRRSGTASPASGDPYAAHAAALALFQPRDGSGDGAAGAETQPRRVVGAAEFLARRPDAELERPASKSSGEETLGGWESDAAAAAAAAAEPKAAVALRDHDLTIDWTHPETRRRREETERRKGSGFRGTVRRLARCFGGRSDDDGDDAGSVRRMRVH